MHRVRLAATAATIAALIGVASAVAAPSVAGPSVAAPPDVDSTRLEQLVTVKGITEHQQALQHIADVNGGTRYTRTSGYTASAAYGKATVEKAGYDAHYEMFKMPQWQENARTGMPQRSQTSK